MTTQLQKEQAIITLTKNPSLGEFKECILDTNYIIIDGYDLILDETLILNNAQLQLVQDLLISLKNEEYLNVPLINRLLLVIDNFNILLDRLDRLDNHF